ncbi:DUF2147 domain-containing protein [Pedobacter sp. SYSU D00535]|uniref:DUF2147 domain-containing protein n=1 Tax=Pedobacter sp. SYSU D00535 TaxID=2810308 RepID=UPI001A956C3D|nr:DUF2147 domain-containing protein [Pedobacter sp. SYSU D00535]
MRTFFLATVLLLFTALGVAAQSADAVLGKWQSGHGSGRIQIYKKGDKYFGKLIWLKEPRDENGRPKVDINNPNEKLRGQPIVGLEVLRNFQYRGNGVWSGGSVYDPKSGNTYNCQMALDGPDKLDIRAFFGITLLGKTETWTRVQ